MEVDDEVKDEEWIADLKDSTRDFIDIVWPEIKSWFNSRELYPVETITAEAPPAGLSKASQEIGTDDLMRLFDQLSGVDFWTKAKNGKKKGLRALASRVQWMEEQPQDKPYDTFTVRYFRSTSTGSITELYKRIWMMDNKHNYFGPSWTVQAYLDERGGSLLSVGRCKTRRLMEHIWFLLREVESISELPEWMRKKTDGEKFLVVPWDKLESKDEDMLTKKCY